MTNEQLIYDLKSNCQYGDYCSYQDNYDRYKCCECTTYTVIKMLEELQEYKSTNLSPDVCKHYKLFEDELISNNITFDELLKYIDKFKRNAVKSKSSRVSFKY